MIDALKHDLAGYKVPKQVFFVDLLPRNSMGKVQKSVLREQLSRQRTREPGSPPTPREATAPDP